MATLRVLTVVLISVGAWSATTQAQTSRNTTALPRVFGGIGFDAPTNDSPETPPPSDPQTRFALERVPVSFAAMRIEGNAAIAARLGAGIEFVRPPTRDFAARGIVVRSTTHRGEKLVLGVARGRLVATQVVAVDVFGGIGTIFQDYELRSEACLLTRPGGVCDVIREERLNRASRATVVGVEAPILIVNHLWATPAVRFYHAPAPHLANGQRCRSPDRRAIGITGRVGW